MIYNDLLYIAYSFFFTGAPIIWFCVFDRQHPKQRLLVDPVLYEIGLNSQCFNNRIFWSQYFIGVFQAGILTWLTFNTMQANTASIKVVGPDLQDEHIKTKMAGYSSMLVNGNFIYQTIVWCANVKLMAKTNTHSCCSVFWQLISTLLFYPLFYLVTIYSIGDDFYGIFDIMFQWVDQWLLLFLFVSSFILVEIGWDRLME